jgi:hypothetical protein
VRHEPSHRTRGDIHRMTTGAAAGIAQRRLPARQSSVRSKATHRAAEPVAGRTVSIPPADP